jgi:signal transduction histidine kinase
MTIRLSSHPAFAGARAPRILVVDDEPLMREIAQAQLEAAGCLVVTVERGEDAWQLLEAQERVDLLLTDLNLPGVDGFGLLDRIRRSPGHAGLPILVMTGSAELTAIDAAYAAGANGFVVKPFDWQLLGYQIGSVLRAAAIEAELRAARDVARQAAETERNLLMLLQHETRTPLNTIVGRCEILRSQLEGRGQEEPRAGATQVMEAAWQLDRTLRRVFHLAQLMTGSLPLDPEIIRVSTIADEGLRGMRGQAAEAQVRLAIEPSHGNPSIACDLRVLSNALLELLGNAIAHAASHGTVTVSYGLDACGRAFLQVRDDGPGLTPAQLATCRLPFAEREPLTRENGGLGIGLATAQRAAELHGGTLEIVSPPGQGAIVRLVLPAAYAQAA